MRLRFAPSPTGALHIGSARTALYNWLLARGQGGKLVLRIEDTDRERSTDETVTQILEALQWLGIDWDEGPLFQSRQLERHQEIVEQLVDSGHAYRSTAGPDDVAAFKAKNPNLGFRGKDEGKGAVRLRVPDEGETVVKDLIRGESVFQNNLIDDLVIARADGTTVYHLAVVVDDLDARISHVVRGADHYSNTPKQMMILKALGEEAPIYAHLPLLNGPDGKKLSKRRGAASVQGLRDEGYLPEAVLNYIAMLGWGLDESTTFISVADLQKHFSLERVSKSPAVFDEQKLRWMNGRYLRELPVDDLSARLERLTGRAGLKAAAAATQEKISTLSEFWPLVGPLFDGPEDDPKAHHKVLAKDGAYENLKAAREALSQIPEPWSVEELEQSLNQTVERAGIKPKDFFQPIRVAVTGRTISPGIFETLKLLGKTQTLERIDSILDGTRPIFVEG